MHWLQRRWESLQKLNKSLTVPLMLESKELV
jgi:hypothetical protein